MATSFPKDQIKFLLLENVHQSAHELIRGEGFALETVSRSLKEDELAQKLRDVHVLGIRSKTQVTARALGEARRLISVGGFCIGTNQVDLAAANERGVPVFNAPFSNTRSVAELIICEVIALARQLGDRSREVHEGRWRKAAAGSFEARGKTLGVIGYGHIGSQVGVLADALGMRVIFYGHTNKLPIGNNHARRPLAEPLAPGAIVTLAWPPTPAAEELMGAP